VTQQQVGMFSCGQCADCLAYGLCGGCNGNCKHTCAVEDKSRGKREVLTCYHKQLPRWLTEVGTLLLDDVIAKPESLPWLPPFVPQIKRGLSPLPRYPAYAVSSNIMQHEILSGCDLSGKRDLLGIPRQSAFVLLLHGKDRDVEPLWEWQDNAIKSIKSGAFDLVVPPDFSVMWDEPRFEHVLNMRRTLLFYRLLQDNDIPTVPHLFWYRPVDLHRHIEWLKANPCVSTIAVNVQQARETQVWRHILDGLGNLQRNVPHEVHFLLCGVSNPARIREARKFLGHGAFTSLLPYMLAVHHRRLRFRQDRVIREWRRSSTPRVLLQQNTRAVAEFVHNTSPLRRKRPRRQSQFAGRRVDTDSLLMTTSLLAPGLPNAATEKALS